MRPERVIPTGGTCTVETNSALQKTPSDERMTSGDRRTRLCGRRLSTMSIVHDQRFHDQRWRRDRERMFRSRALPAEKVDKTGGQT